MAKVLQVPKYDLGYRDYKKLKEELEKIKQNF